MIKSKREKNRFFSFTLSVIFLCVICVAGFCIVSKDFFSAFAGSGFSSSGSDEDIKAYAESCGISFSEYPEELITMYELNPETKDFVFDYPFKKDAEPDYDLSGTDLSSVPLYIQWDQRWGYCKYGSSMMALSGCGPTALSMVTTYLKQDTKYDPLYLSGFAEDNGYYVSGHGTAWLMMSEGAEKLGLTAKELPLSEDIVASELNAGHPIICIMGEGDFTTEAHFIVLTSYNNGKVSVNDPNSYSRSEKQWVFEDIEDQILNLWSYTV